MKVLFVCTANIARSPMAAAVFHELWSQEGHEARSAGLAPSAIRRLTTRDLAWADVVAVMELQHLIAIRQRWPRHAAKVRVLDVPDDYGPGEPELRDVLMQKIRRLLSDSSDAREA
jgi:predicted protein tyrosine phosphatase